MHGTKIDSYGGTIQNDDACSIVAPPIGISASSAQFFGFSGKEEEAWSESSQPAMSTLATGSTTGTRSRAVQWCHTTANRRTVEVEAELDFCEIGALGLIQFANSAMAVHRESRHCALSDNDDLFFCQQLAGTLVVDQGGRTAALAFQQAMLIDPQRPYTGKFSSGSRLSVVKMPRQLLEKRVGTTAELILRPVDMARPESKLAAGYLALVASQNSALSAVAAAIAQEQILDLIALALSGKIDNQCTGSASTRGLIRLRVRAAIDARIGNSDLDGEAVAAAAGISVRYANALLAEQGTSLGRLILSRRLDRCRAALNDPLQSARTIADIATAWGFSDMTHFGRRFKAAYGMSPREYRQSAIDRGES